MIDFYFIYRPIGFKELYRPVGISHFSKVLRNSLENLKNFLVHSMNFIYISEDLMFKIICGQLNRYRIWKDLLIETTNELRSIFGFSSFFAILDFFFYFQKKNQFLDKKRTIFPFLDKKRTLFPFFEESASNTTTCDIRSGFFKRSRFSFLFTFFLIFIFFYFFIPFSCNPEISNGKNHHTLPFASLLMHDIHNPVMG